jgi:hypothetical protein
LEQCSENLIRDHCVRFEIEAWLIIALLEAARSPHCLCSLVGES